MIVEEPRQVINYTLGVTKTVSAYAHDQHLIWVEGRFKKDSVELFITLMDNQGHYLTFIIIGRIFSRGGYPDIQIIQVLGNIGMFSVIGFMLPVLWKKFEKAIRTVQMCFYSSLAIEAVQLFTGRSTDIDDLILNTFGGLLGFLLYAAIKKTMGYDALDKFNS